VNVYAKADELDLELDKLSSKRPYEWDVRRRGWNRTGGPPADTHFARGKKDLEALLLAIEAGEPTARWRQRR
jgi:hypothetical protein